MKRLLAAAALCLFTSPLLAQPAGNIKSGPQPGSEVPGPFHALNLTGSHAGNPHCLVCEYGLRPVVAVFVRESALGSTAVKSLLPKLDEAVGKHPSTRLKGFVVVLSDDFGKEENRKTVANRLETELRDLKNLVAAVETSAGPEKYELNKDAEVTVILYKQLKVEANFAFAKADELEKATPAIADAVKQMIGARK